MTCGFRIRTKVAKTTIGPCSCSRNANSSPACDCSAHVSAGDDELTCMQQPCRSVLESGRKPEVSGAIMPDQSHQPVNSLI